MKKLIVLSLVVLPLIAGCYGSRTADEVCACQLQDSIDDGLLTLRETAPSDFDENQIQRTIPVDFDESMSDAAIEWFQRPNGNSVACVVFNESDRVNGVLEFSADESITEPTDVRWLGIPFGRERKSWEKC